MRISQLKIPDNISVIQIGGEYFATEKDDKNNSSPQPRMYEVPELTKAVQRGARFLTVENSVYLVE
ncbi:MAG: hypothetical protein V1870_01800 [Candidatus Aenigmatarchaeota archaeon]